MKDGCTAKNILSEWKGEIKTESYFPSKLVLEFLLCFWKLQRRVVLKSETLAAGDKKQISLGG